MANSIFDSNIPRLVWRAYQDAPLTLRVMAWGRNYVCPMATLLREVPFHSTVLDIGCGHGLFLLLLFSDGRVSNAVGCDSSATALASAEKAIRRIGELQCLTPAVSFVKSSTPCDWPNGSFSVVSLIDVMHHLAPSQQQFFFEEAARRVAKNGYLLYKDMCDYPWWKTATSYVHDMIVSRQQIHIVSKNTVKQWADACGLKLEKEESHSFYSYGHEKLIFKKV